MVRRTRRVVRRRRPGNSEYGRLVGHNKRLLRLKSPYGIWQDSDGSWTSRRTAETLSKFGPSYALATKDQKIARLASGYTGRGSYAKIARGALMGLGAIRGGVRGFRSARQRFSGRGAYEGDEVEAPSGGNMYGPVQENQLIGGDNPPISVNTMGNETGDITFAHTEFVQNVVSPTSGFTNTTFGINPGLLSTFPFLAQLAQYFTLYEFEGLIFQFKPTSGEFGNGSNQLGKVIMATNYDPDAAPFTSSQAMENYDYAVASKPSLTVDHGVETAPQQQALRMNYIRSGDTTRDKIFTDIGLFQLATEGIPFDGIIGELWVTYKVKLSRAQISQIAFPMYTRMSSDMSDLFPLGTPGPTTVDVVNNLGITVDGNTITWSDTNMIGNQYLVTYQQGGAVPVDITMLPTGNATTDPVPYFNDQNLSQLTNHGAFSNNALYSSTFQINSVPSTLTFPATSVIPGGDGSLTITRLQPGAFPPAPPP